METVKPMLLDWGVASLPLNGQSESGDRYVVQFFPGGILLAVIDGLGHGDSAALAASAAESILRAQPQEPVIPLVRLCHEALRTTRGVVMSIVSFDTSHGLINWVGVGNVRGVLRRAGLTSTPPREELLLRGGVIGGQMPPLQAAVIPVSRGDTLFLATDGIHGEFVREPASQEKSQRAAEVILSKYAKGDDDALVLVARVVENRQ
jgi:negative regulator of sigma-B (phosphoserine phosphatase)